MDTGKVLLAVGIAGAAAGGGYLLLRRKAKSEPGPEEEQEALALSELCWEADGYLLQDETLELGQTTHPLKVTLQNTGPARSFLVEVYLGSIKAPSSLMITCPTDGHGSNQMAIPVPGEFPIGDYTVTVKAIDQVTGDTALEANKTASGAVCKLHIVELYEPPEGPGPGPGGETVESQLALVWNQISGAGTDYNNLAVWAFRNETWMSYQRSSGIDEIGYFQADDQVSLYNTGAQCTLVHGGKTQVLAPGWTNFIW